MTLGTLSTSSSSCKLGARHVEFLHSRTVALQRSWDVRSCLRICGLIGSGPLHSPRSRFSHVAPAGAAQFSRSPTPPTPRDTEGTHEMGNAEAVTQPCSAYLWRLSSAVGVGEFWLPRMNESEEQGGNNLNCSFCLTLFTCRMREIIVHVS